MNLASFLFVEYPQANYELIPLFRNCIIVFFCEFKKFSNVINQLSSPPLAQWNALVRHSILSENRNKISKQHCCKCSPSINLKLSFQICCKEYFNICYVSTFLSIKPTRLNLICGKRPKQGLELVLVSVIWNLREALFSRKPLLPLFPPGEKTVIQKASWTCNMVCYSG